MTATLAVNEESEPLQSFDRCCPMQWAI